MFAVHAKEVVSFIVCFAGGIDCPFCAPLDDSEKRSSSMFLSIPSTFATNKAGTRQIRSFFVAIMRFAT